MTVHTPMATCSDFSQLSRLAALEISQGTFGLSHGLNNTHMAVRDFDVGKTLSLSCHLGKLSLVRMGRVHSQSAILHDAERADRATRATKETDETGRQGKEE